MAIRKFERELPVPMTEEEVITRAKEQSKLELETIEAESEIKRIRDEANAEVKELKEGLTEQRAHIRKIARAVRSGEEFRMVACEERLSEDSVHVETVRLDTNAVVDKRPANDVDRQMTLDDQIQDGVDRVAKDTEAADTAEPEDDTEWFGDDEEGEEGEAAAPA